MSTAETYEKYKRSTDEHKSSMKPSSTRHILAKGANNCVYKIVHKHQVCALRVPRRGSDTQQRTSACQELRNTVEAAKLGVSPHVHDIWILPHRVKSDPSGLYMITDFIKHDLDSCLRKKTDFMLTHASTVGTNVAKQLEILANNGLFVFDLKPSNVLVTDNDCHVKIIDFGSDFCEKLDHDRPYTCPTIQTILAMVCNSGVSEEEVDKVCKHILFAVMLIQISAITTTFLYSDRHKEKTTSALRKKVHPFAPLVHSFLKSMRVCHLNILRKALRLEPIKGVLQHYNSRKYAGTGWTLRLAHGYEKKTVVVQVV